jgi:hypothetical protein
MAVELKRQHQHINESLVFGRMLWLLNLKDNIRTSMKALCLGECYMAVELKRQHQAVIDVLMLSFKFNSHIAFSQTQGFH